ncbi:MAG: response regulator [Oligoflexus sp.]|nr:response regulator [Oligoflexus sp.]
MSFEGLLKSVLIIESDQSMRTLISNYVKGFGATPVEAASSGQEALQLISNNVYDLAIIDWKSKSPTGPELYALLREHPLNHDIHIIFISGQVTKNDIMHTIKDPRAKFVVKPFTEEVFFKAVNDFYKGKLQHSNDKQSNLIIQKGDGHLTGLDLQIHKTGRAEGPSSHVEPGSPLDQGFKTTQSKDQLPTGENMLVKGVKSEGFVHEDRESRGTSFEATEEHQELKYDRAEGQADGPKRAIGKEVGKESENKSMFGEEGEQKREPAKLPYSSAMPAAAVKSPASEQGVAGKKGPVGQEQGQENPSRNPDRNAAGEDAAKGAAGKEAGVGAAKRERGKEEEAGQAALKKAAAHEAGVSSSDKPVGKAVGKAGPARNAPTHSPSNYNPNAGRVQKNGAGPRNDILSDIHSDSLLSDLDESETEETLAYSKKEIKKGQGLNYGNMNQKIHALNRKPASSSLDVLIIDDDLTLTNMIQNYLMNVRTDYVEVCHDAVDGWAAVQKFNYNLIVMDWKSKGLTGLALYNRLRMRPETRKVPIIILTGSMTKSNFRILEDNKCTLVLEKPFEMRNFETAVESIRQSQKADIQINELACQIIDQQKGNRKKIYESVKSITGKLPCKFEFMLAAGQYLIYLKEFKLAQKILEGAARLEPHNVTLMTEMAKVHLRLDHPTESLKLLTEANHFSPGNIERLCLMGEAGLDLFQTDKAQEYFKRALQIDEENVTAKQGKVISHNLAHYLQTVEDAKPLQAQFASTLNLIGITYIKNNQIKNGIEQYHCAMAFIHDLPTIARIQFNLGLAYFRSGEKKLALEWLDESKKNSDDSFTKPYMWYEKIQNASFDGEVIAEMSEAAIEWDSEDFVDSLADSLQQMAENPDYE